MIYKILGVLVISLPVLGLFSFCVYTEGWKQALKTLFVVMLVFAYGYFCVFGGVYIFNKAS